MWFVLTQVTNAFRLGALSRPMRSARAMRALHASPMPFGWGRFRASIIATVASAKEKPVTNAFRLGALSRRN